jgi:hypothetical protein
VEATKGEKDMNRTGLENGLHAITKARKDEDAKEEEEEDWRRRDRRASSPVVLISRFRTFALS